MLKELEKGNDLATEIYVHSKNGGLEMEKKLTATYDRNSKKFHRYLLDEGQGITGSIYIPKGDEVPAEVTIKLRVKEIA